MNEKNLQAAVNKIRTHYNKAEILLFGSQALGTSTNNSDIDLCIIIEKLHKRTLEISREIRKDIFPLLKQSMDILVYDKKTFYERSALSLTLEAEIAESAKVL